MCKDTIKQTIKLGEKLDNLTDTVKDIAEDRKKSNDLLFQLAINQKQLQEQMLNNNREHKELGEKLDVHFSDIKKSLKSKTLEIDKNTSFRQKVLGVLAIVAFGGSGVLLAFIKNM